MKDVYYLFGALKICGGMIEYDQHCSLKQAHHIYIYLHSKRRSPGKIQTGAHALGLRRWRGPQSTEARVARCSSGRTQGPPGEGRDRRLWRRRPGGRRQERGTFRDVAICRRRSAPGADALSVPATEVSGDPPRRREVPGARTGPGRSNTAAARSDRTSSPVRDTCTAAEVRRVLQRDLKTRRSSGYTCLDRTFKRRGDLGDTSYGRHWQYFL
mmetsp:Transcript_6540/g.9924  ORF Transcript_6540/g.9924 Transcript_6540/m.9924 type:complete len:213 (+) Transcript_6540:2-640(+)